MTHTTPLLYPPESLTESTVDRYFLSLFERYARKLPPWQADGLKRSKHLLLPLRSTLPPSDQLKVVNILWEHHGSSLEAGYHLKEDLKRCLRCNSPSDRAALIRSLLVNRDGGEAELLNKLLENAD